MSDNVEGDEEEAQPRQECLYIPQGYSWELNDNGITTVFNNWCRVFAGSRGEKKPVYPNVLDKSGDLTTDITPNGDAYSNEDGVWTYNESKEPHIIKRGQLVKLQLTPMFYATKNGAKGYRFKINRIKILKQPLRREESSRHRLGQ